MRKARVFSVPRFYAEQLTVLAKSQQFVAQPARTVTHLYSKSIVFPSTSCSPMIKSGTDDFSDYGAKEIRARIERMVKLKEKNDKKQTAKLKE